MATSMGSTLEVTSRLATICFGAALRTLINLVLQNPCLELRGPDPLLLLQ
jgi:hypothetical protein